MIQNREQKGTRKNETTDHLKRKKLLSLKKEGLALLHQRTTGKLIAEELIPQMATKIIIKSLNKEGSAVVKRADYWKADWRRGHSRDCKKNHHHLIQ